MITIFCYKIVANIHIAMRFVNRVYHFFSHISGKNHFCIVKKLFSMKIYVYNSVFVVEMRSSIYLTSFTFEISQLEQFLGGSPSFNCKCLNHDFDKIFMISIIFKAIMNYEQ